MLKATFIAFGSVEPQVKVTFRNPVAYGIDTILKALVVMNLAHAEGGK